MNFVGLELSAGNEALKEGRQLDEWIYLSKLKHQQLEIKKNKCGNQIYKTIIEEISLTTNGLVSKKKELWKIICFSLEVI